MFFQMRNLLRVQHWWCSESEVQRKLWQRCRARVPALAPHEAAQQAASTPAASSLGSAVCGRTHTSARDDQGLHQFCRGDSAMSNRWKSAVSNRGHQQCRMLLKACAAGPPSQAYIFLVGKTCSGGMLLSACMRPRTVHGQLQQVRQMSVGDCADGQHERDARARFDIRTWQARTAWWGAAPRGRAPC